MTGRGPREVLVTGAGVCSGLGDVGPLLAGLDGDGSAVTMWRSTELGLADALVAAPCERPDPRPFLTDRKLQKYMNGASKMAVVAAGRALGDAGLADDPGRRRELGLYVAAGLIAFDISSVLGTVEAARGPDDALDLVGMGRDGLRLCHPLMPFKMLLNMPLGVVSIAFGLQGPNAILYPGAGQAAAGFDAALRGIRSGRLDRALVGGTNNGLSLLPLATLRRLGWVAPSLAEAQPFSAGHQGCAPGDGAAFVVLEAREAAEEREVSAPPVWLGAVRSGFDADRAAEPRWELGQAPADVVLATGSLSVAADRALCKAAGELGAPVVSYDGRTGGLGAAALPLQVALGSAMLRRGAFAPPRDLWGGPLLDDPARLIRSRPARSALVVADDGQGGSARLWLGAHAP